MVAIFIVEDGTGKADANAYITEAWADQYWEDHDDSTYATAWSAVTDKEMAIRMATQYLDAIYKERWKGKKKLSTQALSWPRSFVYDRNDYILPNDELPTALMSACAELAIRQENETEGLFPDLDEGGVVEAYSVKAGPVSESTRWMTGRSEYKQYSLVDGLLDDLLEPRGMLYRA
jgi:hypothetical protein